MNEQKPCSDSPDDVLVNTYLPVRVCVGFHDVSYRIVQFAVFIDLIDVFRRDRVHEGMAELMIYNVLKALGCAKYRNVALNIERALILYISRPPFSFSMPGP